MSEELKPCPFCGVIPILYCDITDWKGKPVYKANENGYRPTEYWLKAKHKQGCFIRSMNGTNLEGEIIASNSEILIELWNRRAKNANSD